DRPPLQLAFAQANMTKAKPVVSISPSGEAFTLPGPAQYKKEFQRLQKLATAQRKQGKEIVVVVGLGFVGAVMAAVVADSTNKQGKPEKFVIGMQRGSLGCPQGGRC